MRQNKSRYRILLHRRPLTMPAARIPPHGVLLRTEKSTGDTTGLTAAERCYHSKGHRIVSRARRRHVQRQPHDARPAST